MNIRDAHLPPVPAQTGVTHRRLDVTVSDNGVQQHPQVAAPQTEPAPVAAAAVPVVAPTSTPDSAASPHQGVSGPGVYDPRGRTSRMPVEAQNGRLLDITG